MKNIIIFILLASLNASLNTWSNTITRPANITFNLDDFQFTYDSQNFLQISSSDLCIFSEDNGPALPLFPYEITLDGQYSYVTSKINYKEKLIMSDVIIQNNPVPLITYSKVSEYNSSAFSYSDGIFPNSNFIYTTHNKWSDFSVLHFLVCPFIYDADKRNLYFIETLDIEITVSEDKAESNRKLLNKVPSKIKSIYSKNLDINTNENKIPISSNSNIHEDNVEYVIITTDSLKKAFEPLINWKRTKGLKSKIISVEEIYSSYPGSRNSLKIKNCLYDLYINKGLTYVLLGGDDKIVPVQGCYCRVRKDTVSYYTDYSMPSDIYYSCFGGDFEWDANGNGIYGEIEDNINFTQYLYITRVPIRTSVDASSFITKLLNYEKNPNWSNRMLMCGTKLWRFIKDSTQSDAEAKGDNLYTNYIKPYWDGKRFRYYDTATDFVGGENYNLTNINLSNQLSNGFDFVDMMTHGSQTTWAMEEGASYSSDQGKIQTNIRSSIVTTMACNTNAFDTSTFPGSYDPCLSESLIRNPSSGVIAYLGSSRYGWGYGGTDEKGGTSELGPSLQYESYFYKFLFNNNFNIKNYGVLVSVAKSSLIAVCSIYGGYRWLQLSLNPVGDPEMPIFTEQPRIFEDIKFEQTIDTLSIQTGVEGCTICVMSAQDFGETFHQRFDYVNNISLTRFPVPYCACITKQGYIPVIYYLSYIPESNKWVIQNEKLSGKNSYKLENVELGSNISKELPVGNVEINSGFTEIIAKSVVLKPGFSVKKGAKLKITNK